MAAETETPPAGQALLRLPLAVAGARVMLEQLERIWAHEPGARTGEDPEDVHKMRVATRRLRAARRVFRKALGGLEAVDLDRANAESKALATALGRVRDLDVFAAALRRQAAEAPPGDRVALELLAAAQEREGDSARADLQALLAGGAAAYLREGFRQALEAVAAEEAPASGKQKETVARCAPRLVARALRRLRRAESDLLAPASYELHALRIAAKRARYTCEFFAPGYGDLLEGPIATLTHIQDTLGEVHDVDTASGVLLRAIERVAGAPGRAGGGGGSAGPGGAGPAREPASDGKANEAGQERAPAVLEEAPRALLWEAAPVGDAGPIARLVARYLAARDERLVAFREQWTALPHPKRLRRRLAARG